MDYILEKHLWTDKDFEQMGWHDSTIYRMQLEKDLSFDIDYILKWNKPDLDGLPFTFWISPATLVFKGVQDLSFELDYGFSQHFEIDDIERDGNQWTISTQQGDIRFTAEGYEQYIRQQPFFSFGLSISYIERNGYSLERTTNQENPNRIREDVVQRREKDFQDYEIVKQRHLTKKELEQLMKTADKSEVDLKEYLIKRRELNELLSSYNQLLKETRFESW
jgi:hypothetical protein